MRSDDGRRIERAETLHKLRRLTRLMDSAFVIPGTTIRFGIDPILGLFPAVGDTLSAAISGYVFSHAKQAGVPLRKRMRMLWNILLDWAVGLIPLAGDVFDVSFKANSRNLRIIEEHGRPEPPGH